MARRVVTIFGGSGFIGRSLVQKLAAANWIVRVAVRDPYRAEHLTVSGDVGQIIPLRVDIANPKSVADALIGATAAINMVGILAQDSARSFQSVHVEGAANIAQAAQACHLQSLVHISALGASKESKSLYARSKAAGEQAVLSAFPTAVIIRPSLVFGADDSFFNRFAAMASLSPILPVFTRDGPAITMVDGGPNLNLFGSGGPVFQPVWVGDVSQAVVNALANPACDGKIFELGGPQRYSFKELMDLVVATTGQRCLLVPVPLWMAGLMARLAQFAPGQPLTPDQVALMETDNVVRGGKPGLAELGITPASLTDIVPSYLARYRKGAAPEPRL
jgi:uncharacterized protein YbjT (DUF2867 family)